MYSYKPAQRRGEEKVGHRAEQRIATGTGTAAESRRKSEKP